VRFFPDGHIEIELTEDYPELKPRWPRSPRTRPCRPIPASSTPGATTRWNTPWISREARPCPTRPSA